MTKPLNPSAQKVQDTLRALGYPFSVIESQTPTKTAQQAADFARCELGQIVKSLIFKGMESGQPILVLTSGMNRVDENRIAEYVGEPIGRADPNLVRDATGFAIGGVPPVGHTRRMKTLIDEDLLQYVTIWAAAGTPNAIFELTPDALLAMTSGRVERVK